MKLQRIFAGLTALALLLSLTACGGEKDAFTSMHLVKTEGTVQVADGEGKSVKLISNLGLYSGYGVATLTESYGWILLDTTKLAKLDERSGVEVQKSGKQLELYVRSGALFFNVTEPLAEDETMSIRTSTMVVGIRGTCGWVYAEDADHMEVWLLEGTVECSAGSSTATVSAGEMAAMTADGEITVAAFSKEDIPAFVLDEVEDNEELMEAVTNGSGGGGGDTSSGQRPTVPGWNPAGEPTSEPTATAEPAAAQTATPEPTQETGIAASGEYGDTAWTLSSDGVLTISGAGNMKDMNGGRRPWQENGLPAVQTAIIESGVPGIGDSAFRSCRELGSVTIPSSVTKIGLRAFADCSSLTHITIPDSVTSIGDSAFMGCSSLTSITLPHGITVIPPSCFDYCTNLASITIPNSVTEIYDGAFSGCSSLNDIYFQGTQSEFETIQIKTPVTGISWRSIVENAAIHFDG